MDPAVPAFDMTTGELARAEERAVEGDVDDRPPGVGGHVLRGYRKVRCRVVDEHIGKAERCRSLIEGGTDLIGVTDVAGHPEHTGPECLDRFPARIKMVRLSAGDDQVGP